MSRLLKTLLSIAGSDPCGGAGIQSDVRVGTSMGLHVMTAITSVTAQNSKGLKELGPVSPSLLKTQLDSITEEILPDAIKIGMTGSLENLQVIIDFIESLPDYIPVVVDPILYISADHSIVLSEQIGKFYKERLLPLADVITPNLEENIYFSNTDISLSNLESLPDLLNSNAIVLKGGHSDSEIVSDFLVIRNRKPLSFSHKKRECHNLHGTGCAYSSFLASYLALGFNLEEAFFLTSSKIYEIISRSSGYSLGNSSNGPLNLNGLYL